MANTSWSIERHNQLTTDDFVSNYVNRHKPVIISGIISNWCSHQLWSLEYFKKIAPELNILVKEFSKENSIFVKNNTLKNYVNLIEEYELRKNNVNNAALPPYCHDIPLFTLINSLIEDVQPFPLNYLPKWYWYKWWRYCQFFIGASNSITPLHFDCLLTNNLFFQIVGRKQFTIILAEDAKYCYNYGWRWFRVDPENPNLEKYPEYQKAKPLKIIVNPGDMLYLPPGTLHHVRSLDKSISFNIDWHTQKSSLNGIAAIMRGMPTQNLYYNYLIAMGLVFRIPSKFIFPFYKTYLSYIS